MPSPVAPPSVASCFYRTQPAATRSRDAAIRFPSREAFQLAFAAFCDETAGRELTWATLRWYRDGFRSFLRFLDADGRIGATALVVSVRTLEDWVLWLRRDHRAHVTIRTYWAGLKRFFDYLASEGAEDLFTHLRRPGIPDRLPRAIAPVDCRRIFDAAAAHRWGSPFERARALAVLGCALYAGLRKREILKLTMDDVDLADGTIRIVRGKGRNGGKDRMAYIAPELHELLSAYIDERRHAHRTGISAFFVTARLKRAMPEGALRRIVATIQRVSGVPFSLHPLRHSFVSTLVRQGVPIHVVKDLAGHRSIFTTAGYLRVFDEEKRTYIRRMAFNAPSGDRISDQRLPRQR